MACTESANNFDIGNEKKTSVESVFKHIWNLFRECCFRIKYPLSNLYFSSMGATIVDSLDTLYIMGMTEEFTKAKKWVEANLDMSKMVNTV